MRLFAAILIVFSVSVPAFPQQYDVLIRNGKIVDGSGNPWFHGDVGIVGDRIAFVGRAAENVTAKRTIDASGLVVAPGFIDMLGQSETALLVDKGAVSKLTQGITTEITGEGGSIAPLNARLVAEMRDYLEHYKLKADWTTLDEYFARLEKQGAGVNLATFVGATQVRAYVIGNDDRAPSADELKKMQELVENAMADGALGVSSSLVYAPANYASTEELIALAKVAGKHGGLYATHMRNEGDAILPALEEALRIGREGNLPVQIWHLKVAGKQNWGKMRDVVAAIESARAKGQDVTTDLYPYLAGATALAASIPPKFHEGGSEALLARLRDPQQRAAIRAEIENPTRKFQNFWRDSGGGEGVLLLSVLNKDLKKYEGKTLAQIAAAEKKDPMDAMMDLIVADRGNAGAAYFMMTEADLRLAMQQPWVSFDTDHSAVNTTGPLSDFKAHPRAYGSYTRILGKYVREEGVLRLEDAIRKMTSLAAQRVRLDKRGLLRPDFFADVTIFDPESVIDVATFEDPNRISRGIPYVLVNGVLSVDGGKITGQLGGRPLRGPSYSGRALAPGGTMPKGKLTGVVTDEQGWPLLRTRITLSDSDGKEVASVNTRRDAGAMSVYEIVLEKECRGCTLKAERMGFGTAERTVDYNGANTLWVSFALKRQEAAQR